MPTDAVIPARNEESNIGAVVHTLKTHPQIGNVIVAVDTETTDDTWDVAKQTGAECVTGTGCHRKGEVVSYGLRYVGTERVFLCDADITGLTHWHITQLIRWVQPYRMVIGVPDFPDWATIPRRFRNLRFIHAWFWVSGQRCLTTEIARRIDLHGYLMEFQLNQAHLTDGMEVRHERLEGLHSPLNLNPNRLADMKADYEYAQSIGLLPVKG